MQGAAAVGTRRQRAQRLATGLSRHLVMPAPVCTSTTDFHGALRRWAAEPRSNESPDTSSSESSSDARLDVPERCSPPTNRKRRGRHTLSIPMLALAHAEPGISGLSVLRMLVAGLICPDELPVVLASLPCLTRLRPAFPNCEPPWLAGAAPWAAVAPLPAAGANWLEAPRLTAFTSASPRPAGLALAICIAVVSVLSRRCSASRKRTESPSAPMARMARAEKRILKPVGLRTALRDPRCPSRTGPPPCSSGRSRRRDSIRGLFSPLLSRSPQAPFPAHRRRDTTRGSPYL
eukprot:scaffold77121_cov27-Tisochrysis_lutea.AAC.1